MKKYLTNFYAILAAVLSVALFTGCQAGMENSVNSDSGTPAEESGAELIPQQGSQETLESASSAAPDSMQETADSSLSGAEPDNQDSEELQQAEKMLMDFGKAYLAADTDSIRQYLTDPYEWDIELYQNPSNEASVSGIQCLEEIQGKSIGDIAVVYMCRN